MYSIKHEGSQTKTSNKMHCWSGNLAVVTLVTMLMLNPPYIFASDRASAAEWTGNSGQGSKRAAD
jgi:hypothetical protein